MAFKEELTYHLIKWKRILEDKQEGYKKVWNKLKMRDKFIIMALVGVGICQIVVGFAMISVGS